VTDEIAELMLRTNPLFHRKGGSYDGWQLIEKSRHCDYLEDLCARQAKEIERLRHEIRLLKFEAERDLIVAPGTPGTGWHSVNFAYLLKRQKDE
jgi:hypothetical protein